MPQPPESEPRGGAAPGDVGRSVSEPSSTVAVPVTTLRKRAEFLATRKGARWACPLFVLEAIKRPDASAEQTARFGFTVSKKVGGAVERNRIKRRLRAAVSQLQAQWARPDFDYVLIARRPALDTPFQTITRDLATAIQRVNTQRPASASGRKPPRRGKPS